jgi:hypothetical protein
MDELEEQGNIASGNQMLLWVAWLWVGIPLALGVLDTLNNAAKLFR